jgi:hypothetical protein
LSLLLLPLLVEAMPSGVSILGKKTAPPLDIEASHKGTSCDVNTSKSTEVFLASKAMTVSRPIEVFSSRVKANILNVTAWEQASLSPRGTMDANEAESSCPPSSSNASSTAAGIPLFAAVSL